MRKEITTELALPSEEWDFRAIGEKQLHGAIPYEYARSCGWVREVFAKWHRIGVPLEHPGLSQWAGMTVHELLVESRQNPLPPCVCEWLDESMPNEFATRDLYRIFRINPLFPEPFLKALSGTQADHITAPNYNKCSAFCEVTRPASLPPIAWLLDRPSTAEGETSGLRMFTIAIDFRFSMPKIKQEMWQWLDGLDGGTIEKIKLPKGKAAALPWFRLKELAAYRLSKVGMNFKRAQAHVAAHQRAFPGASDTDVLPSYQGGGFSDAVKSAEGYIQDLFPGP